MSDIGKLYSPTQLKGLDEKAKKSLQDDLDKELTPEMLAIIRAHKALNKRLKDKLRKKYEQLKK